MSRTAALSRYLAALETPVANDDGDLSKQSWQSSVGPNRQQSVAAEERSVLTLPNNVQQQPRQDPVPEIAFTKSMDERDHKVVAVPPSLGMSVKDLVLNKNKLPDGRPRSRSTGRATPRSSRDIVQEVYDRMGVDYSANSRLANPSRISRDFASTNANRPTTTSRDFSRPTTTSRNTNFSSRSITPSQLASRSDQDSHNFSSSNDRASLNETKLQMRRSRTSSYMSPERKNSAGAEERTAPSSDPARSVSRGRARWPPHSGTQSPGETEPQPNSETKAFFPVTKPTEKRVTPQNGNSWKKNDSPPPTSSSNVAGQSTEGVSDNNKDNANKEDMSSDEELAEMPPPGSVKERLSAFAAAKPKRNFKSSVPNVYGRKNAAPPKIDIYSESKDPMPDENTEPNSPPPEPITTITTDKCTDLNRWKAPAVQSKSNSTGPSKVPVSEVASPEESSIVSGLSAEESFMISPRTAFQFNKGKITPSSGATGRPVQERNKVASYQNFTPKARNALNKSSTHQDIDKLVAERVSAQMKDLEAQMAAQMQKLEIRMEEQMKTRMEQMESKIDSRMDELHSMLYTLINGKGGRTPTNYR